MLIRSKRGLLARKYGTCMSDNFLMCTTSEPMAWRDDDNFRGFAARTGCPILEDPGLWAGAEVVSVTLKVEFKRDRCHALWNNMEFFNMAIVGTSFGFVSNNEEDAVGSGSKTFWKALAGGLGNYDFTGDIDPHVYMSSPVTARVDVSSPCPSRSDVRVSWVRPKDVSERYTVRWVAHCGMDLVVSLRAKPWARFLVRSVTAEAEWKIGKRRNFVLHSPVCEMSRFLLTEFMQPHREDAHDPNTTACEEAAMPVGCDLILNCKPELFRAFMTVPASMVASTIGHPSRWKTTLELPENAGSKSIRLLPFVAHDPDTNIFRVPGSSPKPTMISSVTVSIPRDLVCALRTAMFDLIRETKTTALVSGLASKRQRNPFRDTLPLDLTRRIVDACLEGVGDPSRCNLSFVGVDSVLESESND